MNPNNLQEAIAFITGLADRDDAYNEDFMDGIDEFFYYCRLENKSSWIGLGKNALEAYNLILGSDVEEDSIIAEMLYGIVVGTWRAAFESIAETLNVGPEAFAAVIDDAYDEGKIIGLSNLPSELAEYAADALKYEQELANPPR